MKAKRIYGDYLRDIVDYSDKAMQFVEGITFDDFRHNDEKNFAVIRALEVIGEAARHIPKSIRGRHTNVPSEQSWA